MTECPLDHLVGLPSLDVEDLASRRAQLSVRGRRVLDRLLALLPYHLNDSQPASRTLPFPATLLFSICDTLQLDHSDSSADAFVLPSVLSKLRDWRLLDPDCRCSSEGVSKLALDLAGITDEARASNAKRPSRVPLRMKWVSSDSPYESQDRESHTSLPPSPSSSRSGVLDSARECAHVLPDLDECRSDAGYESWQVGRLDMPDAEEARVVVSRRHHSVSGFRSGCSACRHLRLSGPSTPPSIQMSVPFSKFDTNIVSSPRYTRPSIHHCPTKKPKREKHKYSHSFSHPARVDENEPPFPKLIGVPLQTTGISFPRQRTTHSPRISNVPLSRDPSSSVQRRYEPGRLPNRVREGSDKHTTSHRIASVDLGLSMVTDPRASPNDLRPTAPTRAQSFSCTPANNTSVGLGSVGASWGPKCASNMGGSRSGKRLPFWSQTRRSSSSATTATTIHNNNAATTTTGTATTSSVKPTGPSSPSPAKPSLANLYPFGTRLRPSSTCTPQRMPSDIKHRDRRSVSAQTHKNALSVGALPLSPLISARKWQV